MVSEEDLREVLDVIDERIDEIESDDRYPDEDEERQDVRTNSILALMQAEWGGELAGLRRARSEIDALLS